ncbi:MAG: DOMON-like domain-containing protein [Deltaproteobacteria bacterium]|nr:DOMON-like domain-containing protein [Deltaproteobacteria bacterium]
MKREEETVCRLQPYQAPGDGIMEVSVRLRRTASGLDLQYFLSGDIEKLVIPPLGQPQRSDLLWQHTCFETFLRCGEAPAYYEFNFAPSRQWAVYAFRGYRERALLDDERWSPILSVQSGGTAIEVFVTIPLDPLPMLKEAAKLGIGLSAVIESRDGKFSYWALKHPADKPDFHHADSFALELVLPEQSA